MDKIHDIRSRFYNKGDNISQIASDLKMDWKTVKKYVDMEDFNEPVSIATPKHRLCPKLEPFKAIIDEWLMENRNAPQNSGTLLSSSDLTVFILLLYKLLVIKRPNIAIIDNYIIFSYIPY